MRVPGLLLVWCCLVAWPARAQPPSTADVRDRVRQHRASHEVAILEELRALLSIPNIAADRENMARNASLLREMLEKRGVRTRLLTEDGAPPAVYGERTTPGATRTVVFYAHYDGQPVDPARWASPPWTPTLRDKPLEDGGREVPWESLRAPVPGEYRLYARSASDDKSPIIAVLAALDALEAAGIPLSVNLKVFLEGEEEAGSPHLEPMLRAHRELLEADAWILCDGPVHQSRRPQVSFGVRGAFDLEMTTYGPSRALHSGHYGNWAPNPATELAHVIAGMRDIDGRILIKGFEERVRRLSPIERRAVEEIPGAEEMLAHELALGRTEQVRARLAESITVPALNVRGLRAGAVGAEATNAIPIAAQASFDFRLVPDLTPEDVVALVEAHFRDQGYHVVHAAPDEATRRAHARLVWLDWGAGYPAHRTPMDLPVSRAVVRVVEEVAGAPIVRVPNSGGSLPLYLFDRVLGAPLITVPMVNHDNNQHAANENLRLQNLWDGIEVYAALLARLGLEWPKD
jgi:acetylornithine deacetylase/succinyl-diaminopimelate desuccinylase-like protein